MPNWKTLEAKDRLLAAVVASNSDKKLLDYRRIATYYGEGTTYDSIEGQFRAIRKEAQKLRDAVDSGEQEEAPLRGVAVKSRPAAPRSGASGAASRKKTAATRAGANSNLNITNGVISGRVTKNKSSSPAAGRKNAAVTANLASRILDAGALINNSSSRSGSSVHRSSSAAFDDENNFISIKSEPTGDDQAQRLGNFMEDDYDDDLPSGPYQGITTESGENQFDLHLEEF